MKISRLGLSLWIWFLGMSMLDIACGFAYVHFGSRLVGIVSELAGLFVPNLFVFDLDIGRAPRPKYLVLIACPLTIGLIALADWIARRCEFRPWLRVLYNLLILLAITFAVDLIIWHEWRSWKLLY